MKTYYVMYRWYSGDHWHLYNKRDGGFNRVEMKQVLEELKNMGAETKVLTELMMAIAEK